MTSMGVFLEIFNLKKAGFSKSAIARELNLDIKTVRKYLKLGIDKLPAAGQKRNCHSKLDEFQSTIDLLIAKEEEYEGSRLSAVFIFNELAKKGFTGSVSLVRKHLQTIRRTSNKKLVPIIQTSPGEEAQVDWGEKNIVKKHGGRKKVYMFCMTLSHSGTRFVMFTPKANRYYFLKGHIEAFKYFGGVPQRLLYDQTRCAIDKPGFGRVKWNQTFFEFANHYGFMPKACIPYRPQSKGRVENLVKYVKRNFLPLKIFESFDLINMDAQNWLNRVNNLVLDRTGSPPLMIINQERDKMTNLPEKDFDLYEMETRKVYLTSTISYKSRSYSVPPEYLGRTVTIKFYPDSNCIDVYHLDKHLCTHEISVRKYNILPEHAKVISEIMRDNLKLLRKKKRPEPPDDDFNGLQRSLSEYEEGYIT